MVVQEGIRVVCSKVDNVEKALKSRCAVSYWIRIEKQKRTIVVQGIRLRTLLEQRKFWWCRIPGVRELITSDQRYGN